jgi:hypothetical protein
MLALITGITVMAFKTSANLEVRHKMPDPDRFFPSRCKYPEG